MNPPVSYLGVFGGADLFHIAEGIFKNRAHDILCGRLQAAASEMKPYYFIRKYLTFDQLASEQLFYQNLGDSCGQRNSFVLVIRIFGFWFRIARQR